MTVALEANEELQRRMNDFEQQIKAFSPTELSMRDILFEFLYFIKQKGFYIDVKHCKQVMLFTENLLKKTNSVRLSRYSKKQIEYISTAVLLHDIGKCVLPERVIRSSDAPDAEEYALLKKHTLMGVEIVKQLPFLQNTPYMEYAVEVALHHHERVNGDGYPDKLTDNIPIWLQVASLCDVYSALITHRPYKIKYSYSQSISMIICGECGSFDSTLLEYFLLVAKKLYYIAYPEERTEDRFDVIKRILFSSFKQTRSSPERRQILTIRISAIILCVLCIAFVSVMLFSANNIHKYMKNDSEERMQQVATNAKILVEQRVTTAFDTADGIAVVLADYDNYTDVASQDSIFSMLQSSGESIAISNFCFATRDGEIFSFTQAPVKVNDVGIDASYVCQEKKLFGATYSERLRQNCFIYSTPVFADNVFRGSVLALCFSDELSLELERDFDSDYELRILDDKGKVVAGANVLDDAPILDYFNNLGYYQGYDLTQFFAELNSDKERITYKTSDGNTRLAHISKINLGSWRLMVSVSEERANALSKLVFGSVFGLLSAGLLTLIVILVWLFISILVNTNRMAIEKEEHRQLYRLLSISNERSHIAFSHTRDLVFEYDVKSRTTFHSRRARELYQVSDLTENTPEADIESGLVAPSSAKAYLDAYALALSGHSSVSSEIQFRSVNREYVWNNLTLKTIFNDNNNPIKIIGLFTDISNEKMAEDNLAKEQAYRNSLVKHFEYVCEINLTKGVSMQGNEFYQNVLHVDANQNLVYYRNVILSMIHQDDEAKFSRYFSVANLLRQFADGNTSNEMHLRINIRKNSLVYLDVHSTIYKSANDDVCVLILINDNTEEMRKLHALEEISKTDQPTGIYNKASFKCLVEDILKTRPNETHVMTMLDLDGFKQINDTYGHSKGDEQILQLVAIMKKFTRKDDLLARVGGDEFMIFMTGVGSIDAVVKRVRDLIDSYASANQNTIKSTISAGVAVYPKHASDYETLYSDADKALYVSKRTGKNKLYVYENLE